MQVEANTVNPYNPEQDIKVWSLFVQKETNEYTFIAILHLAKNQVIPTGSQIIVFNTFEFHLKKEHDLYPSPLG